MNVLSRNQRKMVSRDIPLDSGWIKIRCTGSCPIEIHKVQMLMEMLMQMSIESLLQILIESLLQILIESLLQILIESLVQMLIESLVQI